MPATRKTAMQKGGGRIQEQAVDWLLRLQAEPDDALLAESCAHWRAADARHERAFAKAVRAFGDARFLLLQDTEFARRAAQKPHFPVRGAVASALVFLILATGFIAMDGPMRLRADAMSGTDEMPVMTLDDGSKVQLNASSAIAVHMGERERRIELLRGEAYFEVAPDAARPFTVEAGGGDVTALGTAFDVKLQNDGAAVTVTEHAVQVRTGPALDSLQLEQGHSVSYDRLNGLGEVAAVDAELAAPWRQGRLIFENQPLGDVVEEIARHLPGKVMIAETGLAQRRITGTFDLRQPAQALDDFIRAFDLKAVRVGSLLTVLRK